MSFWNRFDTNPYSDVPPKAPGQEPSATATQPGEPPAAAPPSAAPAQPQEAAAPRAASAAPPPPQAHLTLGRGVRLEGKLSFSGTVRVDATFQGSIVTDGVLVVGEGAKVDAEISCGSVVVEGEVNGNIVASSAVELRPTSRLHGDVETPSLSIERGALFEGASRRPRSAGAPRASKAAAAPERIHG
jgi:cytoskeletal protein CcmA (bactofilin family)